MIINRALDITPLGHLPGYGLLGRVAIERAGPGYRRDVLRRARSNGILQITLDGCGWCRVGDGPEHRVPVGSAMVFHTQMHRSLVYGLPAGGMWEFLYADLDGESARSCIADIVNVRGHVVPLMASHPAVRVCAKLLPSMPLAHRTMPAAESARLASGLLIALAESVAGTVDPLVDAAMTWLRTRLCRQVSIAECAAAHGMTREHLTRLFARQAGEGPAAWLTRQRLAHARVLLLEPEVRIAAVARACGFASPAHFSAVFRGHIGNSPLTWRRQLGPAAVAS